MISYSVTIRRRDMGIRMALGAGRATVAAMVTREGVLLAAVGVVAGLGGGFLGARLLDGLLFGVAGTDAATYAAVAFLTLLVSAAAAGVPALRATRIDPAGVMQEE